MQPWVPFALVTLAALTVPTSPALDEDATLSPPNPTLPVGAVVAPVGFQFAPQAVVVPVGIPVVWVYAGPFPHTITTSDFVVEALNGVPNDAADSNCAVDDEPGEDGNPDTCNVAFTDGVFAHTFTSPGTYSYFCAQHTLFGMIGTVTVV